MFKIMARRRQAPCSLFGVGSYYVGASHCTGAEAHGLQSLELKNPLILDRDHAQALTHRHATNSGDRKTAAAGAWALRCEVMARGHDGIVAVEGAGDERHLIMVDFDSASATRATATVIVLPAATAKATSGCDRNDAGLAQAS
jgi:hypothetical protein